jgi:hypothetical protein
MNTENIDKYIKDLFSKQKYSPEDLKDLRGEMIFYLIKNGFSYVENIYSTIPEKDERSKLNMILKKSFRQLHQHKEHIQRIENEPDNNSDNESDFDDALKSQEDSSLEVETDFYSKNEEDDSSDQDYGSNANSRLIPDEDESIESLESKVLRLNGKIPAIEFESLLIKTGINPDFKPRLTLGINPSGLEIFYRRGIMRMNRFKKDK